ncbi:MAG: hypothetical protein GX780_01785 [Campylobacteraceae bacterium]|nr:hypothetical protein [Campylobacteraceae bacterium]
MFRNLVLILAFSSTIFAQGLFESYSSTLEDISGNIATIQNSDSLVIGSSGVIIHRFDDEKNTIIARASVIEKSEDKAKVRFEVFDLLEQSALPLPGIYPEKGDTIILNYLYDRSLIVAPNQTVFKEITEHFSSTTWVHPDLMGAYLATEYRPNPRRSEFSKLCQDNSAGIIFFALNRKGYVADCQSFKVLKTFDSGPIAEYQVPFYTRVRGIETAFWKWGTSQISDYNRHYENLLAY